MIWRSTPSQEVGLPPCPACRLQALNALLRKEVHGGVSEARRGLQAAESSPGATTEQDLMMKKADSVK